MPDWALARRLAQETDLTVGDIADRIGWPAHRSLKHLGASIQDYRKRRREILPAPPVYRSRLGVV